tara:strand:- start:96 stop:701 length:606 start_codon:yes stop_codon:yes gene_type:complete
MEHYNKKMKEYKLPLNSFIGGWFINKSTCNAIVKYFKDTPNKFKNKGHVYNSGERKINKKIKDSLDLPISKKQFLPPFNNYRKELQDCLEKYLVRYPESNTLERFNINDDYNIQYYKPEGGFKQWHCERGGLLDVKRILVFMTFLNDSPNGGTMFKYQKLTIPAKKGLTLIWPTDFTHTHKGQISKTHEKYIITGWYSFNG